MSLHLTEIPFQEFHSLDQMTTCLNNWSKELNPKFILKQKMKEKTLVLKIFENIVGEHHLLSKIKIEKAIACQKFDCFASFPKADVLDEGYLDRIKKHTLTISGKNSEGKSFGFEIYSTYNSYDSRHYFECEKKAIVVQ